MKLHVYVLHHKMLNMRKNICEQLEQKLRSSSQHGIEFTYIEEHDPDSLDMEKVKTMVDPSKTNIPLFDLMLKNLHIRQVSNALKHHEAYSRMEKLDDDKDACLVLEDDIIFSDSIESKLNEMITFLQEKKDDWNINFLGLPQPVTGENDGNMKLTPTNTLYRMIPEVSSYFIKPSTARILKQKWFPLRFKTNIQLSYLLLTSPKDEFKVTMSLPNLFVDGTKLGVYLSTLETNNKLILNQDYNKVAAKILAKKYTQNELDDIRKTLQNAKFSNHPDFLMLSAVLEMHEGNFAESKKIFEKCFDLYTANNAILNGESLFLLYYTRIFRYIQ